MARYHAAFTTAAAAAGAPIVDFRSSSTVQPRILEVGLFSTAATALTFELGRSTTLGTTSTTVTPEKGNTGDAAASLLVGTAWSVNPASTATPIRGAALPSNIGAGIIWTFGYGDLIIPVSASLVMMNRGGAAGPICRGYVVYDE